MNDPLDAVFETPEESLVHFLRTMPSSLVPVFQREFMRRPTKDAIEMLEEGIILENEPTSFTGDFANKTKIKEQLNIFSIEAEITKVVYGIYKTTAFFQTADNRIGKLRYHEGKWELFWSDQESAFQ